MDHPLTEERLADMALQAESTLKQLEATFRTRRTELTSATRRSLMPQARRAFEALEATHTLIQQKKRALEIFQRVRESYWTGSNEDHCSSFLEQLWSEIVDPSDGVAAPVSKVSPSHEEA